MGAQFPGLRKLALFTSYMVIMAASSYAAMFVVTAYGEANLDMALYQRMLPIMLGVAGVLVFLDGLLSLKRKDYPEVLLDLATAMLKMLVIMMAISFFLREFAYSRSILILSTVFQFIALAVWIHLCWRVEHNLMIPRRVLVMGAADDNRYLLTRLSFHSHLKDNVKYISPDYESGEWQKFINDTDLVILPATMKLGHKAAMLQYCQLHKKRVFILPSYYELYCSTVDMDKIDDIPVFRPRYLDSTAEQQILKRCLDITVATVATVALIPVFILAAIAIKLDSPGPVIFRQRRVGQYEKEFSIYKFRTMCVDAEQQTGPVLATADDPRITRVGRFLRATRIDELPQLINVLVGDMSIVGPRPERAFFVEILKRELPEYVHRSNVKPGITGMAQVYGKYSTSPEIKLVYDLTYIQKCSVLTDLMIIVKTLRVLISKQQAKGVGSDDKKTPSGNRTTGKSTPGNF